MASRSIGGRKIGGAHNKQASGEMLGFSEQQLEEAASQDGNLMADHRN